MSSDYHSPQRDQYENFDESPEDLAAWRKYREHQRIEAMLPAGHRSPGSRELCSIDSDGNVTGDARLHEPILSGIEPGAAARLLDETRKRAAAHRLTPARRDRQRNAHVRPPLGHGGAIFGAGVCARS